MTSPGPHLFWITSRAAGVTAMVLSSAAVGVGLSMSHRIKGVSKPDRRALHEILSLAVLVAIAIHGFALIGDRYLHPSVTQVLVPFTIGYRTVWTSLGIVSGWALVILGLSYYLRTRIGVERWRMLHRCTALAWLAGIAHSLGSGTDAGETWFLGLLALTALPPLVLLVVTLAGRGARKRTPALA